MRRISWRATQYEHGKQILTWIEDTKILENKLDELSESLLELLLSSINSKERAKAVWEAVSDVLARCNEQDTYALECAPHAYAWLHLLDRYVRTWQVLQILIEHAILPIAKNGVNILDVGTGPGPSGFALCDFYDSLCEYAQSEPDARFPQPPCVTCVEYDIGTNSLRHHLAEILHSKFRQHQSSSNSILVHRQA